MMMEVRLNRKRLGKDPAPKLDEFLEKSQRGEGIIFNPKIVPDFRNFKQGFLCMKLIKILQTDVPKMRRMGQRLFGTFYPFW